MNHFQIHAKYELAVGELLHLQNILLTPQYVDGSVKTRLTLSWRRLRELLADDPECLPCSVLITEILGPGSVIAIIGFCLNGGLNVAGAGVMASQGPELGLRVQNQKGINYFCYSCFSYEPTICFTLFSVFSFNLRLASLHMKYNLYSGDVSE